VCAFTPLGRYILWPFAKPLELLKLIGDIHSIFLRLPAYLVFIFVAAFVLSIIVQTLFALIERESLARQAARDRAAQRVMVRLRKQAGRPRYSLYLRPFKTAGFLASMAVETFSASQHRGLQITNVQIDFEAILAGAFPAHRPLIALGTPGALLPTYPEGVTTWPIGKSWDIPGTGKVMTTEIGWREDPILLANHAETIVIVPLNFPGTIWEIQWLFDNNMLGKCVFVMPPSMSGARSYGEAWKALVRALSAIASNPLTMTVRPTFRGGGRCAPIVVLICEIVCAAYGSPADSIQVSAEPSPKGINGARQRGPDVIPFPRSDRCESATGGRGIEQGIAILF
jgi:hypothetical protein